MEAKLKARMLRAAMNSTGGQWKRQVLIHYLTRKFEDAATRHHRDTLVKANDQDLPVDHQPATGLLDRDFEDAAETISQLASNH